MMKPGMRYLLCVILVTMIMSSVTSAYAAVDASPSSIDVTRGQSKTVTLIYRFSTANDALLASSVGRFLLGDEIIGTVNVPLTVGTQNRVGQVSEVLTIPVHVIERVFRAGAGAFVYQREFGLSVAAPQFATVNIRILPGSIAEFSPRRVELYFDNRQKRSEVMVSRNFPGLKAYADVYVNGSGFLQGYWDIDGRIIERVSRYIAYGGMATFVTPAVPELPTFDPGYHIVRFVITDPLPQFELPQIVYWVKGTEEPVKRALALIDPPEGAGMSAEGSFRWGKADKAFLYLITFLNADDKTVFFSALTRDSFYTIPRSVLSRLIRMNTRYLWAVKGFDPENNIIAESGYGSFSFKESSP